MIRFLVNASRIGGIGIIIALDAGRTVATEDFAHSFGQLPSLEQPMPKQLDISRVGIREGEGRTWDGNAKVFRYLR